MSQLSYKKKSHARTIVIEGSKRDCITKATRNFVIFDKNKKKVAISL